MRFTKYEMIGLYSSLGYKELKGIDLRWDIPEDKKTEKIEETINSFIEKGILDDARNFTAPGKLMLKMLQNYNEASRIILFNQVRIAVCKDIAIVFSLHRNSRYEIEDLDLHAYNKNAYLNTILIYKSDLLKDYAKGKIPIKEKLKRRDFIKEITKYDEDKIILLGDVTANNSKTEYIYYWDDVNCFCYDTKNQVKTNIEVGFIGAQIKEFFTREI